MSTADVAAPARGAYTSLEDLIALRFPAQQLQLARRNRALSALTGGSKSNFRGRGIDFEEVRSYQPGDDIRSIDWRVTARTGQAHTKLFREERERPVLLVVDQRQSMFFGSRNCFKSVMAAQLASLLCWSALDGGDRVGGLVFDGKRNREVRPRRSRRTVLRLLSDICEFNGALPLAAPAAGDDIADTLAHLRRVARPGSNIYLLSDFQGADSEASRKHLFQLSQHTQLTAISCTDPLESQLPQGGRYAVTDGAARSELNTADSRLRRDYREAFAQGRQTLQQDFARLGVPLLEASTTQAPFSLLQTYYGNKRR